MFRLTLPLGLAATSVLAGAGTQLATDYNREVAWQVSIERTFTLETVEMSMERDGEPVTRGPMGGGGSEDTRSIAFVQHVAEHGSEGPTVVVRTFGEVGGVTVMTFGDEEMETELESPFDGAEIEWRLEEAEPVAEVLDGEVEEEGLELFGMALALDGLLPEGEVEEEATWTVDGEVFLAALGLDLESILFPPAPREEPEEGARGGGGGRRGGMGRSGGSGVRALLDLEWEVELKLADAREDSDWGPVARIEFEADGSGDPPARGGGGGGRGGESSTEGGVTAALEGVLLFHLEGKHPVQLACSGNVDIETTTTRQSRQGGEMVIRNVQEGEFGIEVSLELVVEDDEGVE